MFQLQRINKQTNTDAVQKEGEKKPENADLTGWLICATWSGDVEQAGRRLEFDLAYTRGTKPGRIRNWNWGTRCCLSTLTIRRSRLSTCSRDAFLAAAGRAALP